MECLNCGMPLQHGAGFCGFCGQSANTLVIAGNQNLNSAPTLASSGVDIQSAIVATDNPYHSLITDLNMPTLALNDDSKRIWQEKKTTDGRAWYKQNMFHVQGISSFIQVGMAQAITVNDFTLQTLVSFHEHVNAEPEVFSIGLASPLNTCVWNIWTKNGLVDNNKLNLRYVSNNVSYVNLKIPRDVPFLLGIVRNFLDLNNDGWVMYREHIFFNLEWVLSLENNYHSKDDGTFFLRSKSAHVSLDHTKIWIP